MHRVPLLSGSRWALVPVNEGDTVLRAPPQAEQVVDARAAVRDGFRFPLSGPSLDEVVTPGGRATIVVETPALPLPGATHDPRQDALAATIEELERCGIPSRRQTILVTGGLGARPGAAVVRALLPPPQARSFNGRVAVHDAEDPDLVQVEVAGDARAGLHPALVESDLTVTVTAAETVLHGGPGALLAAADARTIRRAAGADSLLEAGSAPEWELLLALEEAVEARTSLLGVSLVLDLPRLTGTYRGYPEDPEAVRRVAHSPLRTLFSLLPEPVRHGILDRQSRRLAAIAAYAARPSVAHVEALLRAIALRGIPLSDPVDALVLGVPWVGAQVPREPLNPLTAAAVALGLALRLRRDAFPVREGGTLVLVHALRRSFGHATQGPYAAMFAALRDARAPEELAAAEDAALSDERGLSAYRASRSCHPLLPFADWAGCQPALARLGRVLVAGSRDAIAARTLGFVPTRGVSSGLAMAHGLAGGRARVGILLAPPYPSLLVGGAGEAG